MKYNKAIKKTRQAQEKIDEALKLIKKADKHAKILNTEKITEHLETVKDTMESFIKRISFQIDLEYHSDLNGGHYE